jgi:hypothetical protein
MAKLSASAKSDNRSNNHHRDEFLPHHGRTLSSVRQSHDDSHSAVYPYKASYAGEVTDISLWP